MELIWKLFIKIKILECEQPFVKSARKLNNGVCLRISPATQKIPKVLQDPPRLGIFLYKSLATFT